MKKKPLSFEILRPMSILPKIQKTCIEMLTQRNYTITKISDDNIIMATKPSGQLVCLFLETIIQFNVDKYQQYITTAEKLKTKHIIVICLKVTPGIQKNIRSSTNMDIKIETFHERELKFNITDHNLVPPHILLDSKESRELKVHCVDYNLLPKLLKTDPVCRFYNFPSGSIIKIIRKNTNVDYRLVR